MSLLDGIENQATKLNILKTLLSQVVNDVNIMKMIQDEIESLEANNTTEGGGEDLGGGEMGGDFGGEPMYMGGGSEPMDMGGEMPMEEPMETGGAEPMAEEPPQEGFETGGGQLLTEDDLLPSWEDIGMDFNDYK